MKLIHLTERQLLYLNLSVFGYDDDQIFELLELDAESGEDIKYIVKKDLGSKFNTTNWTEIVKQSFETELLDTYDHLRDIIKNQANIYTEQIFTEKFMDEISFYDSTEPIRRSIQNFLNTCDIVLENDNKLDE